MRTQATELAKHMTGKTYFYADDEPELYDRAVSLTDRSYEMGHDALQYCVRSWLKPQSSSSSDSPRILDLGCGTGKEALRLLDTIPNCHLVTVDNSEFMLSSFRRKTLIDFGEQVLASRVTVELSDFAEPNWYERSPLLAQAPFDMVVAAHSLHHLPSDTKLRLYGEVAALLRPGGLFAILDLFDFDQPWLSELGKSNISEWLRSQMGPESPAANHAGLFPLARRMQLSEMWLDHLRTENIPLPISGEADVSTKPPAHTEAVLLTATGFHAIEVPFRWFQSGLIVATKRH